MNIAIGLLVGHSLLACAQPPAPTDAKTALQAVQVLVGTWKGTGAIDPPKGSSKAKELFEEAISWDWQFAKNAKDAPILKATFAKNPHISAAELRYLPATKTYEWIVTYPTGGSDTFTGELTTGKTKETILTLERTDERAKLTSRFVMTLLHSNRYLYLFETKPAAGKIFTRVYQVGATKDGEAFANVPKTNECIVTGGKGSTAIVYKGVTYYVCCSGCKDAFNDDPEKYIREAAEKKK